MPAFGQAFGTISGNVVDPMGAVVPGAKVTATEAETGFSREVVSDSRGRYIIPNLRPTQYTLTVEGSGFEKFIQQNVLLLANQAATLDVKLQVGSPVQTLVVNEAAPLVNTTTQTLSDVIERDRMVDLPLNGRNAVETMNLIAGVSGVSVSSTPSQSKPVGATNVNVNGSRDNQTSYALDGANFLDQYYNVNIPFPFPDALQEFSVQTNNYSARYGENAGGVVNVVTKSGTNQYHGDLFEFVRNPIFNARPYFATQRDQIKRNQFGGTVGGPVTISHLYNGHDRTFFFFGYQGERYRDASTGNAFVPTDAELGGDFSALLTVNPNNPFGKAEQIIDPTTGKQFQGNMIPANRLDPASLKLSMNYLPRASGNGQVFFTNPVKQSIDQYILRMDHRLTNRDDLTGRYFRDHILLAPQNPAGNLLAYGPGIDQPVNNVMVQETHTFRANLLNQASFTLSDVPTSKTFASDSPNVASFGVAGLWLPADRWLQSINVSGAFSINGGAKGPFNNRNTGVEDNLSWVAGRHNLDIGVTFDHSSVDLGDQFQAQGSFTFNATTTNNQIASFMLGYLNNFTQGYGEYKNNRNNFWAFYFNDSFHLLPRLTLNYGLRYEPYSPWKEIKGRTEQFRIGNFTSGIVSQQFPNAPPGLLFPGDPGMPFDGVTGNYTNFAPRFGFAYDASGDGKTSIRGGAGVFYDSQTAGVINNRFADISPFSPQVSLTPPPGPFSEPLRGYAGFY
ncbi:MAG TPA: carboxypeptidase regulatory-like domain-containing protein, partial [Candidatus Sulfotelmatobacter sp.]|nr:carboxypeptidase regulatory-like domain-containing protein [Candidatus Sulfotelmatobacter sp.]